MQSVRLSKRYDQTTFRVLVHERKYVTLQRMSPIEIIFQALITLISLSVLNYTLARSILFPANHKSHHNYIYNQTKRKAPIKIACRINRTPPYTADQQHQNM